MSRFGGTRSSRKESFKAEMSFMCEGSGIPSLCMVHSVSSLFLLYDAQGNPPAVLRNRIASAGVLCGPVEEPPGTT